MGASRGGRLAQRRARSTRPRRAPRRATGGWRCSASSRPIRAGWPVDRGARAARLPAARARHDRRSLCQVAAARFDGMVSLRRCRGVDAAAGQLIVREAGGLVSFPWCDEPLGAPLDARAELAGDRRPAARRRSASSRGSRRDRLGRRRADRHATSPAPGDARTPTVDLAALAAESERRVVAYTGLKPARPAAAARGDQPAGVGVQQHRVDARCCSTRCSSAPAGPGPLQARRCRSGRGWSLSTEVGVVVGYLAQRVLGQYELVLLDEAVEDRARRGCCSCSRTSARRCADIRRRRAGVHDLGGAPRGHPRRPVRRRAVAARARRRPGAGAAGKAPRCGSTPPRKLQPAEHARRSSAWSATCGAAT